MSWPVGTEVNEEGRGGFGGGRGTLLDLDWVVCRHDYDQGTFLAEAVPEPNDWLRRAREYMESREVPGVPMSRQELAELVNAYLYETTGHVYELDDNYIDVHP